MTHPELHLLLAHLEDHGEVVLQAVGRLDDDPLRAGWRAAQARAEAAYADWRRRRDAESFLVYRAFADQADAAQDALARRA
jgi:hypothetical protein